MTAGERAHFLVASDGSRPARPDRSQLMGRGWRWRSQGKWMTLMGPGKR